MKPLGEERKPSLIVGKKALEEPVIQYFIENELGEMREVEEIEFQMIVEFEEMSGIKSEIIEEFNKIILKYA